jgi:hypothetical protein
MEQACPNECELLSEEDADNTPDFMLINQTGTRIEEVSISTELPRVDKVSRTSPRSGTFKCSQCFNLIELGRPIYMRNDFPYCSKDCRELGVSSVYRVLFGSSVDNDSGFVTRLIKHMGGSSASISSFEDNDEGESSAGANAGVASAARAKAQSFFRSAMRSVSKTSLGSSFIRTYSNSVLWGKDISRNTSFSMLFSYLPELPDDKHESCGVSPGQSTSQVSHVFHSPSSSSSP